MTRYKCTFCPRSGSSKKAVTDHINNKCWKNPDTHSCKTCANYVEPDSGCGDTHYCNCGNPEMCDVGISLKVGLQSHCPKWEPITEEYQ